MKKISGISLSVFIVLSAILCSCELLKEDNDCDATKMDAPQEPVIYLKVIIPFPQAMIEYNTPERLLITGSIRKIYCSGKESGNFTYNPTIYVSAESFNEDNTGVFVLPQPYQYKFDNTKDKLIVICRVKAYLEGGDIYESEEIYQEFFYKDIKYNANEMKHYIEIRKDILQWFEVTSR